MLQEYFTFGRYLLRNFDISSELNTRSVDYPKRPMVMHGSILPVTIPSPGNPRDKSSPPDPGVGNCLKRSCPGDGWQGKSKITSHHGSRELLLR